MEHRLDDVELVSIEPSTWDAFAGDVLAIEQESFPHSLQDSLATMRRLVLSPTSIVLGAKERVLGSLVGYLAGDRLECFGAIPGTRDDAHYGCGDTFYLETVAVRPAWRHQGLATAMMRECFEEAKSAGSSRVTGHIASDAIHLLRPRPIAILFFDDWYGTGKRFA